MDPNITPVPDSLQSHTRRTILGACTVAVLLVIVYIIWFGFINETPAARDSGAAWGAFGDFFGGILNPLVAGLALFWLTRSIEMQKVELAAAKEELKLTKIAQQDQATTLEKQRYEQTFFALLEQHNAALAKLTSSNPLNTSALSDADFIRNRVFTHSRDLTDTRFQLLRDNDRCGHYFRVLFQILKFVAIRCPSSTFSPPFTGENLLKEPPSDDEKMYSNIVRSFIGSEIVQLLAVNCVCDEASSYWPYMRLIERYSFLEHMPFTASGGDPIQALLETTSRYRPEAFGKSDFLPRSKGAPAASFFRMEPQ
jgi:hypothetical protein